MNIPIDLTKPLRGEKSYAYNAMKEKSQLTMQEHSDNKITDKTVPIPEGGPSQLTDKEGSQLKSKLEEPEGEKKEVPNPFRNYHLNADSVISNNSGENFKASKGFSEIVNT